MIRKMINFCSRLGIKHASQLKKVSMSMPEEPHSSSEVPQASPEEPQSSSDEPQSSSEKPQSSLEETQSSSEEPQSSSEETQSLSEEAQSPFQQPRAQQPEFLTETRFDEFDLPPEVLAGLKDAGFEHCTPIQAQTLPVSLTGRDVAGQAQTGTGKTGAFLVTVLNGLLAEPVKNNGLPRALIVAPTRELSQQIYEEAKVLCRHTSLSLVQVVGGVDYVKQADTLRGGVDIVICTPGRIIDYYKQKIFKTDGIKALVIDEADRLLDLGFAKDMRYILRKLPPYDKRQSMLFSATLSYRVMELTYEFMNLPEFISVTPQTVTVEGIEQSLFHVGIDNKIPLLLGLLKREEWNRMLIFVNTKAGVEYLTYKLKGNGWPAEGITGDLPQRKRFRLMAQFKQGQIKILVATDVASRGIHVEDISHVINYDLPQDSENYVHRIGRTARAGKTGKAISLACEKYVFHLEPVEEMLDYKIPVIWPEEDWYVEDRSKPFPTKRKARLRSSSQRRTRSDENRKRAQRKPQPRRKPSHFPGAFFGFGPEPQEAKPEPRKARAETKKAKAAPKKAKAEPQKAKAEPQESAVAAEDQKPKAAEKKKRSPRRRKRPAAKASQSNSESKARESKAREPKVGEPKARGSRAGKTKARESVGGEPKAGESRAGEPKARESKAGELKARESEGGEPKARESEGGEPKARESEGGEPKARESEGGEPKAGKSKGGEPKAGESEGGEPEAGEPKTDEPKASEPKPSDP